MAKLSTCPAEKGPSEWGRNEGNYMSTATKNDLRDWLKIGFAKGARYMLVVCDTYDFENYPVYVTRDQSITEMVKPYNGVNMQKIMECYDLTMDWDTQLNETRSWHGWRPW